MDSRLALEGHAGHCYVDVVYALDEDEFGCHGTISDLSFAA